MPRRIGVWTSLDLVAAAIDDLFPGADIQAAGNPLLRRRDQVSLLASLVIIQSARDGRSVGLGAWRWQRRRLSNVAALRMKNNWNRIFSFE
jgi:hypothetical protein